MSITFLANRSFSDYALLSRAFAVAVEGEFRNGQSEIEVQAKDNPALDNLLVQLADSTRDFLTQKGIRVTVVTSSDNHFNPTTVVSFGNLSYYPHKDLVKQAKRDGNITVLEY